jgi:hypothetical protein
MLLNSDKGSPLLPILVAAAIVAVMLPVFASAFRIGFRLARLDDVTLKVVAITSAAYSGLLVLLVLWPVETHAVRLDMPVAPEQSSVSLVMNVLLPVGGVVLAAFAFPLAVAFVAARVMRARPGVS